MNALKHGLCAAGDVLLPHEDPQAYNRLRDDILDGFHPEDSIEIAIAQRLINAKWKLKRVRDAEAEAHRDGAQNYVKDREDDYFDRISRERLPQEEFRALCQASQDRRKYDAANIRTGQLLCAFPDEWDLISRHEQRLEAAFFRALRELRQWRREKRLMREDASDEDLGIQFNDETDDATDEASSNSPNEPTATKSSASGANAETCEQRGAQTVIPIVTSDLLKAVQTPYLAAPLAERDPEPPEGGA